MSFMMSVGGARGRRVATLVAMLASVGALAAPPRVQQYDALARLPDWSGVWTLLMASGMQAGQDAAGTDNGRVPLTPEYRKIRDDAHTQRAQNNMSTCLPAGVTGALQHGMLFEFLFNPGRVTMLIEDGEVRRIYTDGRAHLKLDQLRDSFQGDSVGHWEGDTLVVDTIGFPKADLFQNYGVRGTLQTHLVERMHLKNRDTLQIDNTLTDPKIFAKPYTYTRYYTHTSLPLSEPVCAQNNRDTGDHVDLTPPPEEAPQ